MKDTVHLGKRRRIIDGLEKVSGKARFTADVALAGMLHARPVLSPYPHARIRAIDTAAALAVPGVIAVLTGAELNGGRVAHSRPSMLLAQDEVRFAGQPVAVVVAASAAQAADAAALLDVDYEVLDSVDDAEQAMTDERLVWPQGCRKRTAAWPACTAARRACRAMRRDRTSTSAGSSSVATPGPRWPPPTS